MFPLLAAVIGSGLFIVMFAYIDGDIEDTQAEVGAALGRRRAWHPRNLPKESSSPAANM